VRVYNGRHKQPGFLQLGTSIVVVMQRYILGVIRIRTVSYRLKPDASDDRGFRM
jgi:hypothetical protein